MDNLVSIIMPSYNTQQYIGASIESVLNQTYKNWELIIIDDCSTDDTITVVSNYKDNRIHFYVNEKNIGAAESRNNALKISKGRWIAFLDSDDLWKENKLEEQLKFMRENKFSFSYTNYQEIDSIGNSLGIEVSGPKKISKLGMHLYCWPGCLTVMYDSTKLGHLKIKNMKKNNDYALWLKIIDNYACYLLDESLAFYRRRSGSISNSNYLDLITWHFKLWRYSENLSLTKSCIFTGLNIIFGVFKKVKYKKTM